MKSTSTLLGAVIVAILIAFGASYVFTGETNDTTVNTVADATQETTKTIAQTGADTFEFFTDAVEATTENINTTVAETQEALDAIASDVVGIEPAAGDTVAGEANSIVSKITEGVSTDAIQTPSVVNTITETAKEEMIDTASEKASSTATETSGLC